MSFMDDRKRESEALANHIAAAMKGFTIDGRTTISRGVIMAALALVVDKYFEVFAEQEARDGFHSPPPEAARLIAAVKDMQVSILLAWEQEYQESVN